MHGAGIPAGEYLHTSAAGEKLDRVQMFSCPFDRVDMAEAIRRVEGYIARRDRVYQSIGVNVDQLLKMQREPDFARIVRSCDLITADGTPVIWFSRLFQDALPERVPSVDIMFEMLPVSQKKGYRIFMLGAKEVSVQKAADNFEKQYPGLQIVGRRNGYFKVEDEAEITRQINDSKADMLFIAISSPKKEEFVERNRAELKVPFVLGVGGAFDIAAGLTTRAPRWMQKSGVEITWRVIQEPKRMGPRFLDDLTFVKYVLREYRLRRRTRLADGA